MDVKAKFLIEISSPEVLQELQDLFFSHQIAMQILQRELGRKERRASEIDSAARQMKQAVDGIVGLLTFPNETV